MHNSTREERIAILEKVLVETEQQLIDLHRSPDDADGPQPPPPPPNTSDRPVDDGLGSLGGAESWLRYSGIAMVVASAIFFVSTAIRRGWIGPTAQLSLATLLSLGLIGLSFRFGADRRSWTITMAIGGTASLLASGVVGYLGLDLLSYAAATGWLVGSILIFLGMAHVHDSQAIALASVPALFFGAALASADSAFDPTVLTLVGAGYVASAAVVSHDRSWMLARAASSGLGASMAILGIALSIDDAVSPSNVSMLGFVSVACVLLAAFSQALEFRTFEQSDPEESPTVYATPVAAVIEARIAAFTIPWISAVGALIVGSFDAVDFHRAWVAMGVAAVLGALVAVARPVVPLTMRLLHGVSALATMTLAVFVVVDGPVLLVSLLAQTLLATWLAWRFRSIEMVTAACVLGALVLAMSGGYVLSGTFVFGLTAPESVALAAVVVALAGAARWLREHNVLMHSWAAPWLFTLGWASASFRDVPQGQMIVSMIWALVGAGVVVGGAKLQERMIVGAGLISLAITAAKLVFIDLATVDVLWRAGLFFAVGALFLRLAFVLPALMTSANATSSDLSDADESTPESGSAGLAGW